MVKQETLSLSLFSDSDDESTFLSDRQVITDQEATLSSNNSDLDRSNPSCFDYMLCAGKIISDQV